MTPEIRIQILNARGGDYNNIMRTTIFTMLGIAAAIHFAGGAYSAPLMALTIAATLYGILAGGVALDDIMALRDDMDDDTASSNYGKLVSGRNIPALKMTSSILLGLVGLAEIYALVT